MKIKFHNLKINNSGYTIIEMLIALFIFVIMLVLYSAASNSVILNREARQKDLALRILVKQIENLRAAGFASLPASGALSDPMLSNLSNSTLQLYMSDIAADLKQATVKITWKETENFNSRSLELTTYMNKRGL